jgi:uncharacterized protein
VTAVLADAGPLIALLDERDRHHSWARDFFDSVPPPIFTCEPVLTECCYLLRRVSRGEQTLLRLVASQLLTIEFALLPELEAVRRLMERFSGIPMSLADACLVRMSEIRHDGVVVTIDSDFRVYRRNRRQIIPTIMPE